MKVIGTKVIKINSKPGDSYTDGTEGYLIAETKPIDNMSMGFILFPNFPLPVGIASSRYKIISIEEEVLELPSETVEYLNDLKTALPNKLSKLIKIRYYEDEKT